MRLQVAVFDSPTGSLVADWSARASGTKFSSNGHGFAAASGFVPLRTAEAFHWYERPGLPHVVISDGAAVAWEGRLEDVALVPGGIRFAAFGYWRALSDLLYTALWSSTDYGAWQALTGEQIDTALEGRFEQDQEARLYITPRLGELHGVAVEAFWAYVPPHRGARDVATVAFDYEFNAPSGWEASFQRRNSSWGYLSSPWLVTSTGTLLSGSVALSLTAAERFVFALREGVSGGEGAVYDAPLVSQALTTITSSQLATHDPAAWTVSGNRFTAISGTSYSSSKRVGQSYAIAAGARPIVAVSFSYTLRANTRPGKWRAQLVAADEDFTNQRVKWSKTGGDLDPEAGVYAISEAVTVEIDETERVWLEFYYDDAAATAYNTSTSTLIVSEVDEELAEAFHDAPTQLDHVGLVSVTVTNYDRSTTYVQGTDYTVNAAAGQIQALSTGTIPHLSPMLVTYTHTEQSGPMTVLTLPHDTAVSLGKTGLKSGSVSVKNITGNITYTEGTDYTINYSAGTITALSTGTMTNNQYAHITFTYTQQEYETETLNGDTYFEFSDFRVQEQWATGDHYLQISNIRLKTTSAATVYPSVVAAALVAYVSATNSSQLSASTALIAEAALDLMDLLFEDSTPAAALEYLAGLGDNNTLYEAGVWEDRRLHFRPRDSKARTWLVDVTELELERILDSLYNSAYTTYQDDFLGTQRTATSTDSASVNRYGVTRQASGDTSSTSSSQAEAQRDSLIDEAAELTPRAAIRFTRVYNESGGRAALWEVRAGDTLVIRNLPPTLGTGIDNIRSMRLAQVEYSIDTDELKVEAEIPPPTIEALLAEAIA